MQTLDREFSTQIPFARMKSCVPFLNERRFDLGLEVRDLGFCVLALGGVACPAAPARYHIV